MDGVSKLLIESPPHGESDPFSQVPAWSVWVSTIILCLAFIIGFPLNGATVIIFWRRKKLRHLVNFVLLLDCLSHIFLCTICIPILLVTAWSSGWDSAGFTAQALSSVQQVVGNFSNIYSTFLTVSIAILRYRRLCWKKKDKFSTSNAIKWSVLSGCIAVGLTFAQSYSPFLTDHQRTTLIFYLIKIFLIVLSMLLVFFCYIRVSQRVWTNATSQEKIMDPVKLKKSRTVHLRATIHSCVQIILIIATLSPHLYEQTLEALAASEYTLAQDDLLVGSTFGGDADSNRLQGLLTGGPISGLQESSTMADDFESSDDVVGAVGSDFVKGESLTGEGPSYGAGSGKPPLQSGNNQIARLLGMTINYALLVLGTPMAYIASCHRFREQFTSILFSNILNSPQNSALNHNSPQRDLHRGRTTTSSSLRLSSQARSQVRVNRGRCYSNPISRVTGKPFYIRGSCRSSTTNGSSSNLPRASISLSTNNTSSTLTITQSLGGSVKSRSSFKRAASVRRRNSHGLVDFTMIDSESRAILQEQDSSNSSNSNAKATPSPSPIMIEGNMVGRGKDTSIYFSNLSTCVAHVPTGNITGTTTNLDSLLTNYGYDCGEFGQNV